MRPCLLFFAPFCESSPSAVPLGKRPDHADRGERTATSISTGRGTFPDSCCVRGPALLVSSTMDMIQTALLEQMANQLRQAMNSLHQNTTGMTAVRRVDVEIYVRPLDMNISASQLQSNLGRAMAEKAVDDEGAYGRLVRENGYTSLGDWAQKVGYRGSDLHRVWAEAASVRTKRQISADWWMQFDAFGGTAGAGPNVLPQGIWPGMLASIAMGHDTDWGLGRYFGVGPMASLKGAPGAADELGLVGLLPQLPFSRFSQVPLYTAPTGMVDWVVRQIKL